MLYFNFQSKIILKMKIPEIIIPNGSKLLYLKTYCKSGEHQKFTAITLNYFIMHTSCLNPFLYL